MAVNFSFKSFTDISFSDSSRSRSFAPSSRTYSETNATFGACWLNVPVGNKTIATIRTNATLNSRNVIGSSRMGKHGSSQRQQSKQRANSSHWDMWQQAMLPTVGKYQPFGIEKYGIASRSEFWAFPALVCQAPLPRYPQERCQLPLQE